MTIIDFKNHVSEIFSQTNAFANIDNAPAVIMERIARGGGATNWFYCQNKGDLIKVIDQFHPGSAVSLYFDCRLKVSTYHKDLEKEVSNILNHSEDCVVGVLKNNELKFKVDFVTGIEELNEFVDDVSNSTIFMFGPFPGRDNDGESAITVILPDEDGVVRAHPH